MRALCFVATAGLYYSAAPVSDVRYRLQEAPRAMKILLVEDDLQIGKSVLLALNDAGYDTHWVKDRIAARDALTSNEYAVVLLDLGLAGVSGVDLRKAWRAASNGVPTLILTARDEIDPRGQGLDVDFNDYLLKPFGAHELLARIRAVLQRNSGRTPTRLGDNSLSLDLSECTLTCNGVTTLLCARELALMLAFLECPGAILSRAQLADRLPCSGQEAESGCRAQL